MALDQKNSPLTQIRFRIVAITVAVVCAALTWVYYYSGHLSQTVLAQTEDWHQTRTATVANSVLTEWMAAKQAVLTSAVSRHAILLALSKGTASSANSKRFYEVAKELRDSNGFVNVCVFNHTGAPLFVDAACPTFSPTSQDRSAFGVTGLYAAHPAYYVQIPLLYKAKLVGYAKGAVPLSGYVSIFNKLMGSSGEDGKAVAIIYGQYPGTGYTRIAGAAFDWPGNDRMYLLTTNAALREAISQGSLMLALAPMLAVALLVVWQYMVYRRIDSLHHATTSIPLLIEGNTALLRSKLSRHTRSPPMDEVDQLYAQLIKVTHLWDDVRKAEYTALVEVASAKCRADSAVDANSILMSLTAAAEEEKARLAQDLHDETGQRLVVLKLDLDGNVAIPPERVARLRDNVAALQQSVKAVLHRLRPPLLDVYGLSGSIEFLTNEWREQAVWLKISLKQIPPELDNAPDPVQVAVYRIVQEAITNCVKHATADSLIIDVSIDKLSNPSTSQVILRISDNGKGFIPQRNKLGLGITGMRNRVLAIGGTFEVDSELGAGTKVCASLPLPLA